MNFFSSLGSWFGNIFGGLGSLFTLPNMLSALDLVGKGLGVYGQIGSLLNQPQLPDYDRLDRQGNQPLPVSLPESQPPTPPLAPQDRARQFASARRALAERGVYSGGAFENPEESFPWMFGYSIYDGGQDGSGYLA